MAEYRIYPIGRDGHFSGIEHIKCSNDQEAIQEAKQNGLEVFDFGRSDWHNQGLITFKNRWGATQSNLTYWRHDGPGHSALKFKPAAEDWKLRAAKAAFSRLPSEILSVAGNLFYKHVG